jgi:ketosteroid isomerase-like protein
MMIMAKDISATARAAYNAYVTKDRAAIEAVIADDFHFTSPLDNGLNRESYFAICWPNSANTEGFDIVHMIEHGDQVFVTYEGRSKQSRFRNTEILTVRNGQIVAVEVYFGWSVPHEVPVGEHRNPK